MIVQKPGIPTRRIQLQGRQLNNKVQYIKNGLTSHTLIVFPQSTNFKLHNILCNSYEI